MATFFTEHCCTYCCASAYTFSARETQIEEIVHCCIKDLLWNKQNERANKFSCLITCAKMSLTNYVTALESSSLMIKFHVV